MPCMLDERGSIRGLFIGLCSEAKEGSLPAKGRMGSVRVKS